MEKEKNKRIKIVLLILVFILLITVFVSIFVISRFTRLKDIKQKSDHLLTLTNYTYFLKNDETEMICYKSGTKTKAYFKSPEIQKDIITWRDESAHLDYYFDNNQKTYFITPVEMFTVTLDNPLSIYDDSELFRIAFNPFNQLKTKQYDGKECYYLQIDNEKCVIDKTNATKLKYTDENGNETLYDYQFDSTTEEDVRLPDLNEYTLIKNNND